LKRKDLIETMAKNIPSGAIRFGCHIAEIHPANPDNHGAVLTTLDGSIIRAKVTFFSFCFALTSSKYLCL